MWRRNGTIKSTFPTSRLPIIISLLLVPISTIVSAAPVSPFSISNYAPLVQIFGLPPIADLNMFDNKNGSWSIQEDYSSHFAASSSSNELAMIDGESRRTTVNYYSAVRDRQQWQIAIPYIEHNGGILDSFIEGWHAIFQLPKGSRDKFPQDQLIFYYRRDGEPELNIQNPKSGISGIGDILLTSQWQTNYGKRDRSAHHSVFVSLKLPTGDDELLLGSGGVDVSVGFAGNEPYHLYGYKAHWYLSSGLLRPGPSRYLSEMQKELVFFGGLGTGVPLLKWLVAKVQVDGHSAFYSGTSIAEIGQEALQLTFGGQVKLSREWRMDFGLSEDLLVNASPDITLHLAFYAAI